MPWGVRIESLSLCPLAPLLAALSGLPEADEDENDCKQQNHKHPHSDDDCEKNKLSVVVPGGVADGVRVVSLGSIECVPRERRAGLVEGGGGEGAELIDTVTDAGLNVGRCLALIASPLKRRINIDILSFLGRRFRVKEF